MIPLQARETDMRIDCGRDMIYANTADVVCFRKESPSFHEHGKRKNVFSSLRNQ
jgi:hypothetical protein